MSIKDVCDKLDIIIALLSEKQQPQQQQHTERPARDLRTTSESIPVNITSRAWASCAVKHALNRSKYVNDEQRTQIFNYIQQPKVVTALNPLPKHRPQSALHSML